MRIRGVGVSFANAILSVTGIDKNKKTRELSEEDIKKIEVVIKDPAAFKIPFWMFNRRKDYETGADKHLVTSELDFTKENDIRTMRKIKCYKGVRHSRGLPVRGQRTKGHFRRGESLGVAKRRGMKAGRV